MTNPDAVIKTVIKTVKLKTLLTKAELRVISSDCPFSEASQPLYIQEGIMNN